MISFYLPFPAVYTCIHASACQAGVTEEGQQGLAMADAEVEELKMGIGEFDISPMMRKLSSYIAAAVSAPLPAGVLDRCKYHLLDTLGAIVSGATLLPGSKAISYVRELGGSPEALVIGTDILTSASNAALANGMQAHADETDDLHQASRSHLGCAVVPAALAMAQKYNATGQALLRAIVLGYDVGSRTSFALNTQKFYEAAHSTHSFAAMFGAAASAGALAELTADQVRWVMSYAAQQASGVNCWRRDREHIEKAFDFGGMPARNGVAAATMVKAGFTGVDDVFSGERNFFIAYGQDPSPDLMIEGLGQRFRDPQHDYKEVVGGLSRPIGSRRRCSAFRAQRSEGGRCCGGPRPHVANGIQHVRQPIDAKHQYAAFSRGPNAGGRFVVSRLSRLPAYGRSPAIGAQTSREPPPGSENQAKAGPGRDFDGIRRGFPASGPGCARHS